MVKSVPASNETVDSVNSAALSLFNVLPARKGVLNADHAALGFVTDFKPSIEQLTLLKATFKPVNLVTLFSLSEAKGDPEELFTKNLLHYFEVYGLDSPGLFNLEVEGGKTAPIRFVKAVTLLQLTELVSTLINANAPIKDVKPVATLVKTLKVKYDINTLPNRELRVVLLDPYKDTLSNGDDAVRWLCYTASKGESALLIKDKTTIAKVTEYAKDPLNASIVWTFLRAHTEVLAQVFNRHKALILPLKASLDCASVINRISHLSKTKHVPYVEAPSKSVIARFVKGENVDLSVASLRDKFNYLNLIQYKLLGLDVDVFNIRNGKIWTEINRPVLDSNRLEQLREQVLQSLKAQLKPLKKTRILLDEHVDYGLPISRKQTLGNLPYGTTVNVAKDKKVSMGIYWRNDWGARDLDLSAISVDGERIGWGGRDSYGRDDFTFSGDMVDATNGACEFFTVDPSISVRRAMLVNIFRGNETAQAELIVGYPSKTVATSNSKLADSWQDHTILREKIDLQSKQTLLGFIRGDSFVVYSGRLGSSRVSNGEQPVTKRGLSDLWTLGSLFKECEIPVDIVPKVGIKYTHDLRYASFSFDKVESMFSFG